VQCTFQKLSAGASTKSLRHPMGNCCSSTAVPVDNRKATSKERVPEVVPRVAAVPRPQQGGTKPAHELPQCEASSYERPMANVDDRGATLQEQVPLVGPSRLPSQQSGTKPALVRDLPQVGGASSNGRPTANVDDRGVPLQEHIPLVVRPVAAVPSRLPSQQSGTKPARNEPQVGGASSYDRPTVNVDNREVTLQKQIPLVVPPVAAVPSRLPSQQSGTKPARDEPQVGGASSYDRPTVNIDNRDVTSQKQIPLVVPVTAVPSRLPSQSGTKPARDERQVGGASSYERPTVDVDDREVTLQKQIPLVVPPVAAVPSRLPPQQSGTKPARESPQVGGASPYARPTVSLSHRKCNP